MSRHGARISSSERGTVALCSDRGTVSTLPQSLHLPLLPAALSLTRIERPHFGQAKLMVMARDPLVCVLLELSVRSKTSMETDRRRIKIGGGKNPKCPLQSGPFCTSEFSRPPGDLCRTIRQ